MRKYLLVFLFAFCVIAIRMYQEPSIRLRKSIHALNETQRKSMFWCIKMLAILPAPEPFKNWTYKSILNLPKNDPSLEPVRIIDILISSHSSSCEHSSLYFAHYHRHLMIMTEVWLNIAHDVLRKGKKRLLELYPSSFYQDYSDHWDNIFMEYKQSGMAKLSVISIHYWNPTNYKNKDDLIVPIELAGPLEHPNKKLDVMDHLFHDVLNHWPWQTNVRTRLISPKYEWNQEQVVKRLVKAYFFNNQNPQRYTHDQLNLLNLKLTPRNQPKNQDIDDFYSTLSKFYTQHNLQTTMFVQMGKRFRDYFETVGNNETLPTCTILENEIYVLYGASFHNQNYGKYNHPDHKFISKKQQIALNMGDFTTNTYNKLLPHYTLAYALFNKQSRQNFTDYLKSPLGIVRSHNLMHNYRGYFLTSGLYSIISIYFYNFHSWIDATLEFKIRMSNFEDQINNQSSYYLPLKQYLENSDKIKEKYVIGQKLKSKKLNHIKEIYSQTIGTQLKKFYDDVLTKNESDFAYMPDLDKAGSHLVMEWIDFQLDSKIRKNQTIRKPFIGAFPMRDYMITPKNIRSSREMGQIYRKMYVKNNGWRFKGLIDLQSFPFDYNYEIYNGPDHPTEILNHDASNLPKYLREMQQQVQQTYDILDPILKSTIETIYNRNFEEFYINDPQITAQYGKDIRALKQQLFNHYRSFLYNSSFLLVKYPSYLKPDTYPIKMRLKHTDCLPRVKNLLEYYNISSTIIDQLIPYGIAVQYLNVRSSQHCHHHCHQEKQIILDLGADLFNTNKTLWKLLRILQLGDTLVIADSRENNSHHKEFQTFQSCLSKTLQFVSSAASIKVGRVQGVQKVNLFVQKQDNNSPLLNQQFQVKIKAAAVGADKTIDFIQSKAIIAENSTQIKLLFKQTETEEKPKVTNHIKSALYHEIKIQGNSRQSKISTFHIHSYSKQINHKLYIGIIEQFGKSKRQIQLKDADFAVKRQFLTQIMANMHD